MSGCLMYKLDGLVIQLCIRKFTGYDLRRKAMGKVVEFEGEIESKRTLQQSYRDIAAARGWMGKFKPYEF